MESTIVSVETLSDKLARIGATMPDRPMTVLEAALTVKYQLTHLEMSQSHACDYCSRTAWKDCAHCHGSGRIANVVPEVGMGATVSGWSDIHAATVVEIVRVKSGSNTGKVRWIVVQRDIATLVGGTCESESQEYIYQRDPYAYKHRFTQRDDGTWHEIGGSASCHLGGRREYRDPSF